MAEGVLGGVLGREAEEANSRGWPVVEARA
jgi:hypothetical protein